MPRFAANLSLLYAELPLAERFAAAAADGFDAVEFQFPHDTMPAAELAARAAAHGLEVVLVNAPPGDVAAGERGLACLPGREADFRRGVEAGIAYAQRCGAPRLHVLAGLLPPGRDRAELRELVLANYAWAAAQAPAGLTLLVEPINQRDMPGYYVNRQDHGHEIVEAIGAPNLKVQMDLYHCQVVEGDLASKLRRYLPTGRVGHLQFAGVPQRQEPDVGEVHYPYLFEVIDELGWTAPVGAEYRPRGRTSDGLQWFAPYRQNRPLARR